MRGPKKVSAREGGAPRRREIMGLAGASQNNTGDARVAGYPSRNHSACSPNYVWYYTAMCNDTEGQRWLELDRGIGKARFHRALSRFPEKVTARQSLALPNRLVGTARRAVRGRLGEVSLPRNLDASSWPKNRSTQYKSVQVNISKYK
jgi:hypothetical protein